MTANLIHGHRPGRLALPAVLSLAAALVSVTPVVAQVLGWSVGTGGGTIVQTADGSTWSPQTSGTGAGLSGVSFTDASNGWAVGTSGTIIHTTDGGATWSPQTSGTSAGLSSVKFTSPSVGWAVGTGGTIVH